MDHEDTFGWGASRDCGMQNEECEMRNAKCGTGKLGTLQSNAQGTLACRHFEPYTLCFESFFSVAAIYVAEPAEGSEEV
jgi:hypothetical protein